MKANAAHHDDSWFDDRIEAYLDGDLPEDERERFEQALQENDFWQAELALAVNLRDELRALDAPALSPEITRSILHGARNQAWRSLLGRIRDVLSSQTWKPALATLAVILVAFVLIWTDRPQQADPGIYTETDVEQALAEVKWTLGYVSKTGRMTGDSVQDALAPLFDELPNE